MAMLRPLHLIVGRRKGLIPSAVCSLTVVEVVEAYREYRPGSKVRVTVQELLDTVPPGQLSGLGRVVLTNSLALTGARKRRWSWYRGKKLRHAGGAAGLYHHATRTEPAWIEVFVDRALSSVPGWALQLQLVRSGFLGRVLFHEIGHHIHATQRPEHRDRETIADEWQRKLMRMHARRRHMVATTLLRPLFWLRRRAKKSTPAA